MQPVRSAAHALFPPSHRSRLTIAGLIMLFAISAPGLVRPGVAATAWTPETSGTTANLYGVARVDADTWVAVGDAGTILRGEAPPTADVGDLASHAGLALEVGPNPFRGETRVAFQMPRAGHATLKVYDVLGEEVATLIDGPMSAGDHVAMFEARGLPSGLHYSRLEVRGPDLPRAFAAVRPVVLVR